MGVWIIDAEPDYPDLDFYITYDVGVTPDFTFYIQNEPDDSDAFYIQFDTGTTVDDTWYLQNEPTEHDGDQFYIEGDPGDADAFYIQDNEEPGLFYFVDLFSPDEELQFYFSHMDYVEDDSEDNKQFFIQSEFDAGRHDWRSELANSGEHYIEVSEAIEDLMVDLEDLQLTPLEIQIDQDSWIFDFDE